MPETIDLFMWGYQSYFRDMCQEIAEEIFKSLDEKLNPKLFLVGVLVEERENRFPVCIEPEDCGYDLRCFDTVKDDAEHFRKLDDERNAIHSHAAVQSSQIKRIELRSLKNAILKNVIDCDYFSKYISYCSWPALIEGYRVCVVLQFEKEAFDRIYELHKDFIKVGLSKLPFSTSLINATINAFFDQCVNALNTPSTVSSPGLLAKEKTEILRDAGDELMQTPAMIIRDGMRATLFNALNNISSMRYEGEEGKGSILLGRKTHPNIEQIISFNKYIDIYNIRAVRKLLEISSDDLCLLSDTTSIYGIGRLKGFYNSNNEDLFKIRFLSHYTWELSHANYVLMQVSYQQPNLPKPIINENTFKDILKRLFVDISETNVSSIWQMIKAATTQRHGTMVVISRDAIEESTRLASQSTPINPTMIPPDLIPNITAIDGAILIDIQGNCHAIGVILDGLATDKGDNSRGARYNSAIRYVESRRNDNNEYTCLAVIISEDGMINLIPDLRPRVKKSLLEKGILELEKMKETKTYDHKRFNGAMSLFQEYSFYLSEDMCNKINTLRPQIESLREKDISVYLVYSDFETYSEMNESYFLDEK